METTNIEGIELKKDKLWIGPYVLGKLLGGLEGKEILDLGCGAAIECCKRAPNGSDYHPMFAERFLEQKAIVYGLDKDLISLDKEYLKRFQEKTGVIPIPGWIEDVDEYFKDKQFEGIFSHMTMGLPTEYMDWEEILKKLYSLTKPQGYQYHYNHERRDFKISKKTIEDLGYKVLHYFENEFQKGWEGVLLLKKR